MAVISVEYCDWLLVKIYIMTVIMAAGSTIKKFALNLSFNSHPCVLVEAMVVSEMNERLSPKNAPPTTAATSIAVGCPVDVAIPVAIGTNAATVPTEVPMLSDTKHAVTNSPASIR